MYWNGDVISGVEVFFGQFWIGLGFFRGFCESKWKEIGDQEFNEIPKSVEFQLMVTFFIVGYFWLPNIFFKSY